MPVAMMQFQVIHHVVIVVIVVMQWKSHYYLVVVVVDNNSYSDVEDNYSNCSVVYLMHFVVVGSY